MSVDTTDPALVSAQEAADISSLVTSPVAHVGDVSNISNASSKERHSLTLDQRRALRRWAIAQPVRPSHKTCIEWFFAQYGQTISQSTVSHSLSPKYSRLDGDTPQLSGSRLRFGNWPDVEKLVLLWYQQVQASGRQPTNEELGEKAKAIFTQLPRYKDEAPPEFSPGWIHRFKKRYGLLIRRQRRHGDVGLNPAEDIAYLADCVPRFMAVAPDTSPATIREHILRVVGVEASLGTCALVRDEIIRRLSNDQPPTPQPMVEQPMPPPPPDQHMYDEDDPEVVLQNALRALQQEEQAAEEHAAAVREERDQQERMAMEQHHQAMETTPSRDQDPRYTTDGQELNPELTLTPIHAEVSMTGGERPLRCPFCVNQRMLRSIKEAVEHLSTHVVV